MVSNSSATQKVNNNINALYYRDLNLHLQQV